MMTNDHVFMTLVHVYMLCPFFK